MKFFRELSLKTKLVVAFAGMVLISGLLSSIVYSVVLVSTMKKSAREKIEETAKVASHQIDQRVRGLEIYADLIGADITFGQVLSFDSSMGIAQKIEEFKTLSQAELVAFVPKGDRYVQIKDQIFVNKGNEALAPLLGRSAAVQKLNEEIDPIARKGWFAIGNDLYLLAMKPVLHFGANMGVILLAQRTEDSLAAELAKAAGADIAVLTRERVLGTSLQKGRNLLFSAASPFLAEKGAIATESLGIADQTFLTLFTPLLGLDGEKIGSLAVLVSNSAIREAQAKTLRQVILMASMAAAFSALIGYFLARAISLPLQTITGTMLAIIEKGDLGIRISGSFGSEIGILSRSFNRLVGQLQDAHEKLASSERRMKEELTMASTVQEMLFPERLKSFDVIELASFIESSTETGGDWYGYSQDRQGSRVSVMIGDVTGHGMPAALITAIANGFFKGVHEVEDTVRQALLEMGAKVTESQVQVILEKLQSHRSLSTADLLLILNELILDSTKGSLLMTFFASVYDSARSELLYANAGHNRPMISRGSENGEVTVTVLPSAPSNRLGEDSKTAFVENSFKLVRGDILLWYTDGLLECENPSGEMYGKRRLMNVLKRSGVLSAEETRDAIIADARRFFGDHPRKDDITLVVGRVR